MNELVIDWVESTKIAGNNLNAAKEFIHLLAHYLKNELPLIQQAFENHALNEMKKQIHSLHGALCYCSVPSLKKATIALENALKTDSSNISHFYSQFTTEITHFLKKIKE